MLEPSFPWTARLGVMIPVFVVLLVVFDLLFVRWLKFGKQAWKRIDYFWLGFATLGLIGAVTQARIYAAKEQLSFYQTRVEVSLQTLRSVVAGYADPQGFACQPTFSPAPEYRSVCEWDRTLDRWLESRPVPFQQPIEEKDIGTRPALTAPDPTDIVNEIFNQISVYNQDAQVVVDLQKKAQQTEDEERFGLAYPFWLVVALALRITKVTGELKLA